MARRAGWFLTFVDEDGEVQNAVAEVHPLVWLAHCEQQAIGHAHEHGLPRPQGYDTWSRVRVLFYREMSEETWKQVAHVLPAVST